MYMTDFEYNGELLSEHGCVIGSVSSIEEQQPMVGNLTLNTIKNRDINKIINVEYEDVLTKEFDIIKSPCGGINDLQYFDDQEIASLMVWLNRKQYLKFSPIYDEDDYPELCFYGTFTSISSIIIGGKVVGFHLLLTTNAPYGYEDYQEEVVELSQNNANFSIYNNSQELGYLYPDYMIITCDGAGDIIIHNNQDEINRDTIISNCSDGEIITINCQHEIIFSSDNNHTTLMNDFNYNFPRLVRNYAETYNTFSFDKDEINGLSIRYKYKPIRKVGVIG